MKTHNFSYKSIKPIVFLVVVLSILGFQTISTDSTQDKMAQIADEYLSSLTNLKQFNGVVLLKKGDKMVLRKAYNISNNKTSTLFVSETDQFDLRSVAKLFAKVSLMELEEQELIKRSATLDTYLPDFPQGDQISIQQLMDHSSGLPREFTKTKLDPVNLNPNDVVLQAMQEQLEFVPGSKNRYSNVGYQLLYYLIGDRYGSTFIDFLREIYFDPLKMNHSGSNFDDPVNNKTDYAYGHKLEDDGEISCYCSTPKDDLRMGNLYSTADDLSQFLQALDPIKNRDIITEGRISHAGGSDGKRAYVERDFEQDYQIVFLANYDEIPFEQLVADLRAIATDKTVQIPRAVNRTPIRLGPDILKRYTGTYDVVDAGHLMLTIKLENDSLFLYQKGQNNGYLYPESEDVFYGDPKSTESIQFKKDSLGNYFMLVDFQGVQWKGVKK